MIISCDEERDAFIKKLMTVDLSKKVWEATAKPYKGKRSLEQNALAAIWYRDRGKQTGHGELHERCTCKLMYGVPIMMQDEDFSEAWQPYISQTYERQLKAMEIIDVTSLMNPSQMTNYMNEVENNSFDNGLTLTKPKFFSETK